MNNYLPNFLIVGATKSGTTSLYKYLIQHPQIYLNESVKETNFFVQPKNILGNGPRYYADDSYAHTFDEYLELFKEVDPQKHKAIGEVCTTYLHFYKNTIPNIKKHLEDPKIIIILRNPVERAYSHYMHNVRDGDEELSFEEALNAESRRIEENLWLSFRLKTLGYYLEPVKSYLKNFSQVKVYIFEEDLVGNELALLDNIASFLNVRDYQFDKIQRYNKSGTPQISLLKKVLHNDNFINKVIRKILGEGIFENLKNKNLKKGEMDSEIKKELLTEYMPEIKKLESVLNRDLSIWYENK